MIRHQKQIPASGIIILILVLGSAIVLEEGYTGSVKWYWVLFLTIPLLLLAIVNIRQKRHAILRDFPLVGYLRYFFESIRLGIRHDQLFINGQKMKGKEKQTIMSFEEVYFKRENDQKK